LPCNAAISVLMDEEADVVADLAALLSSGRERLGAARHASLISNEARSAANAAHQRFVRFRNPELIVS
jgi:hypothetical protein